MQDCTVNNNSLGKYTETQLILIEKMESGQLAQKLQ